MIKVALHISGNETDHSLNIWGQVKTDPEEKFSRDKLHMDQRFKHKNETMKILIGAGGTSFCFSFKVM